MCLAVAGSRTRSKAQCGWRLMMLSCTRPWIWKTLSRTSQPTSATAVTLMCLRGHQSLRSCQWLMDAGHKTVLSYSPSWRWEMRSCLELSWTWMHGKIYPKTCVNRFVQTDNIICTFVKVSTSHGIGHDLIGHHVILTAAVEICAHPGREADVEWAWAWNWADGQSW